MKPKTQNTTLNYEPVKVKGTGYEFNFTKTMKDGVTNITATPKKESKGAGFLSYNMTDGKLILQVNNITAEERQNLGNLLKTVGESIAEIAGE